tara:strand:+ start:2558 stop:2989 length:432 start_codon:yes stop_codon:yes gene_type:complete
MKVLRKHIRKEISSLMEMKYPAPVEILGALKDDLKLSPVVRYVDHIKAVNSVPPSYEIFLHNTQSFYLIIEHSSIVARIGAKEYWLGMGESQLAQSELNRLLTQPLPPKVEDPNDVSDEEAFDDLEGGGDDDSTMEDDPETEA